jgi:hypothetical protein
MADRPGLDPDSRHAAVSDRHPYFFRPRRSPKKPASAFRGCGGHIDLSNAHLPPYPASDAVRQARGLFDARAAAAVATAVSLAGTGGDGPVRVWPPVPWEPVDDVQTPKEPWFWGRDLLELKWYGDKAPTIYLPTAKCLSALAYLDFFPERFRSGVGLRSLASAAILAASPGWCGTFGPGVDGTPSLLFGRTEGNYDMSEMHLLHMAYQYYDALSGEARERLITLLLARGRIHRPNRDDTFTSGVAPNDWGRAGYISPLGAHKDLLETENHILMIATARYLTNQLLFQRDHDPKHDNRRNGGEDYPSSVALLLGLLRNILRDDFSEYNAKSYQEETRWALLNLCTYAYDDEVRLAARMVLDYLSAHMAVSSDDLRRMLPFRRRNEGANVARDASGSMTVGLVAGLPGVDPMDPYFAMQAGNTRAYETSIPWAWSINNDGTRVAMEVLSGYRLPTSIHDLFVNDLHRRFFQRLHRTPRDELWGNRNADNSEIYAGSPSYLITAGGSPSGFALDPRFAGFVMGDQDQQLGVGVTTSFMPTGLGVNASDLIQFGTFTAGDPIAFNYGVAPDFACGHNPHLPGWVLQGADQIGSFLFVDRSRDDAGTGPGFFLAIHQTTIDKVGTLAVLEALDTWLHPETSYEEFVEGVLARNGAITLAEGQEFQYTTSNRNRLWATIRIGDISGAEVRKVEYGGGDRADAIGDAGNVFREFLTGTVLSSPAEAVVTIANPSLGTTITLDMSDMWHPRRISEEGEVEEAGGNHEVWLDFDGRGPSEGDVCRPYTTVRAAVDAVAEGGTIRVVPGTTTAREPIGAGKRVRFVAPIGGVIIGARDAAARRPIAGTGEPADPVRQQDLWVQFDFPESAAGNIAGPFNKLSKAIGAVRDGDTIRIVPGVSGERTPIGIGKRFTLFAPLGGVTIGLPVPPPPAQVWVKFDWPSFSPGEGTSCEPFKALGVACAAVASGGEIKVMPSVNPDRSRIGGDKPFRLSAPSGGVTIGARP